MAEFNPRQTHRPVPNVTLVRAKSTAIPCLWLCLMKLAADLLIIEVQRAQSYLNKAEVKSAKQGQEISTHHDYIHRSDDSGHILKVRWKTTHEEKLILFFLLI